jgi:hypothetical protein
MQKTDEAVTVRRKARGNQSGNQEGDLPEQSNRGISASTGVLPNWTSKKCRKELIFQGLERKQKMYA